MHNKITNSIISECLAENSGIEDLDLKNTKITDHAWLCRSTNRSTEPLFASTLLLATQG